MGLLEYRHEVLHVSGTTGCHQRHVAVVLNRSKLFDVVAIANAILTHAIEHNFAGAEFLRCHDPFFRSAGCPRNALRVASVLVYLPVFSHALAIDSYYHALRSKPPRQLCNQWRIFQRRRIDGNFVRAFVQDVFGSSDAAYTACDAKRDVEQGGDIADPLLVDRATVGARGYVVKHEFICTRLAIACRAFEDVADNAMIAKLYALDDFAVTNVKAGNYATGRNVAISRTLIFPSKRARPLMAAWAPISRSALRSSMLRTPPDACR